MSSNSIVGLSSSSSEASVWSSRFRLVTLGGVPWEEVIDLDFLEGGRDPAKD